MKESTQLIRNTKKKFFIYSFIGIILVFVVSLMALNLHTINVDKQASIQEMYSSITKQLHLINKISTLGEKFEQQEENSISIEINNKLKNYLKDLNIENSRLQGLLEDNDFPTINNIETMMRNLNSNKKMLLFIKNANELVNNKTLTNTEIEKITTFLGDSSREGIGELLALIGERLKIAQKSSLSLLNRMGFILVGLCILQVILIWLLVFRPLYKTIAVQHEKITESMLRAESANRSKTDFLANISHEIRTPMTAIMGYADILKRENVPQTEKDDAVAIIDRNASHLLSLIDEILDISKIESGKFVFEREEVNLSQLLNEVYSLINVKAEEKNIELIFKNDGKIPERIMTDSKRLKQVLFNIVGNAIKFTDKGFVELRASYSEFDNMVSLIVKDSGIGMAQEHIKKLFRPFEQADSSVKRKFGGTGLGLVLARGLANGMGGDVKILESKIGVGTSMEILIDAGSVGYQEFVTSFSTNVINDKPSESCSVRLDNTKILVVDDAKENARLFKLYLSEAGADVDIANDGETALKKAEISYFDIILLDLQMPGKDGFQVIKELRDKSFSKPIVALTAHAMKEEKEKTKNAGFDDHITKPVKSTDLIQAVSKQVRS